MKKTTGMNPERNISVCTRNWENKMKKTREELKEKILWNLQMNTILERNAIDIEDLYFAVVEVLKENIFD